MTPEVARLAEELNAEILKEAGTILHEETLRKALGFSSVGAMAKAITRNQVPLPFFRMPNRRGRFCLTREVACFIARQRAVAGGLRQPDIDDTGGAAMT